MCETRFMESIVTMLHGRLHLKLGQFVIWQREFYHGSDLLGILL